MDRFEMAEEIISELEIKSQKSTTEEKREKQIEENAQSLGDLWDHIKYTNLHGIRVPER